MADNSEIPAPVRAFMEKARSEGWSDPDIISYVRAHQTPNATPATLPESMANVPIDESGKPLPAPTGLGHALATNPMIQSAAQPGSVSDMLALAVPEEKALAVAGKGMAALGSKVADASKAIRGPLQLGAVLTSPVQGIQKAAAEYLAPIGGELIGRGVKKAGELLHDFSQWKTPFTFGEAEPVGAAAGNLSRADMVAAGGKMTGAPPLTEAEIAGLKKSGYTDGDIQRVQQELARLKRPASQSVSTQAQSPIAPQPTMSRAALPAYKEPIITPPPADPSGITVTKAAKTEFPTRDPQSGRMRRTYTSQSEGEPLAESPSQVIDVQPVKSESVATPATKTGTKPPLSAEVTRLTEDGYGAKEIATKLRDHPDLKGASEAQRINLVRDARGGEAGQLPGKVKQAIDAAIDQLTTESQKRDFLMRAPNAVVYNYAKGKLGL